MAEQQGSFGYGQQTPGDSSGSFAQTAFLIRQMMAQLDTMKLVKVVKVTAAEGDEDVKAAGTVDVLPLVNQIDGNGNATAHGTVYGIPWSRMQGGTNAVVCDPQVDDIGYVVAADRDISAVKSARKRSNPGSFRRFSIADGIYIGGALNVAPEQYLVFTETGVRLVDKNGNSVALDEDGITLTDKSGNVISTTDEGISLSPAGALPVTVNGNLVVMGNMQLQGGIKNEAGATYAGAIATSGEITAKAGTAGSVTLSGHRHTQPNDGHGDIEQPTAAPTGGT